MSSITVEHPDYRPGRGEKQLDRGVALHGEAATALQVWATIYGNRIEGVDPYTGVNRDAVTKTAESGTVLGGLVQVAVSDAQARPLSRTIGHRAERYDIACTLSARHAALAAPAPIAESSDSSCSHGVPFTDDCTACEW